MKEYQEDMTRRDLYVEVLAVEREEGMKAGELKGREEGIVRAAVKAIQSGTMGREQVIALFELEEIEMSVLDVMLSEGDVFLGKGVCVMCVVDGDFVHFVRYFRQIPYDNC